MEKVKSLYIAEGKCRVFGLSLQVTPFKLQVKIYRLVQLYVRLLIISCTVFFSHHTVELK